jgi:3D (Asp-Asp-Asp) domain-containing protein
MSPAAVLSILVNANTRDAVSGLGKVQKHLGKTERASDRFAKQTSLHARMSSRGFSGISASARGATAGVTALAGAGVFLIKQFEDSRKVSKQTAAVLRSTGHEANVSAKHVSSLATALSKKSGMDDEAIQSGENLLLTFTKIRNETGKGNKIFDQSTRIITDMSAALGQDMKSSAIQVGKALNDPIKGVTALQRVGVSFTEDQKKQIKTLEETGHHLQAQKLILHELNTEFAGSAKAQATPFMKLKVTLGNLAETLGGKLAPYAEIAARKLNKFVNEMMAGTGEGGRFVDKMREIGLQVKDIAQKIVTDLKPVVQWFLNHPQMAAVALGGWASYKVGALGAISSIAGALIRAGALKNPFTAIFALAVTGAIASQQTITAWSSKVKQVFEGLRKETDPHGIDTFAAHLDALGQKGGPFGADMRKAAAGLRSMNKPALDVQNAIDKLAHGVPADMDTIATSVRLNMRLIKREMGSKSAEAKEALSKNFMAGVDRVRAAMAAGLISTKQGLAKIAAYFRKDLALYGITGKQASRYLQGNDTLTGVSDKIVKAKGGWIGHPGQAGGDNVPIVVGRGEAVLNRHQQGPVQHALQATYGMSLGDLFSRIKRPHYMAGGGFAGMVAKANQIDAQQYPYLWGGGHNASFSGPYDCSGAVSAVLHAGGLLGAPRVSGDLMNYGKAGPGPVTVFANRTHTYMRLGGKYFGTSKDNPGGGAGWFPGAPRSGFAVRHADATMATIKRVMFPGGMGALSGIGQAGLDGVRSGANRALTKVAFGGYTGGGDPPGKFGGGGFVSTSYGPPWGGIQGTGVTRTGVNLKNSPHIYGIAVDPSVLSLGQKYKVWPNPFGYRGAFKAFDTGGAIKGNRIDFYDWRGRQAQLGWGRRDVTVAGVGTKAAKKLLAKAKKKIPNLKKSGGAGSVGPAALPEFTSTPTPFQIAADATEALQGVDMENVQHAISNVQGHLKAGDITPEQANQQIGDILVSAISGGFGDLSADDILELRGELKDNTDSMDSLRAAQQALADNLAALKDEVKRQNDFSTSVANVTSFQAIKALADVISGQIVGVGYAGRSQTASAGQTVRY